MRIRLFLHRFLLLLCMHCCAGYITAQQQCPPNIGFEQGNFDNWVFANGSILKENGEIRVTDITSDDPYRQLLYDRTKGAQDPYGQFPTNSPNGSRYALKLGNDEVRAQAERASYTFKIPSGQDQYTLIYYYAVVFQNHSHQDYQQPRFTSRVFDVTENKYLECGSYEFIARAGLPGFRLSDQGVDVYYKPWSPVSINLSGYAGKTIRLEFTNNDCSEGGHFGYAYLDMNENCSEPVTGNVACIGTEELTLQAPPGFQQYQWFTGDFSTQLGTGAGLIINPAPPAGTSYKVRLVPYAGLGCIDTVGVTIRNLSAAIDVQVPAVLDGCAVPGVNLINARNFVGSTPGLSYMWYENRQLTQAVPDVSRIVQSSTFYLQSTNADGCTKVNPVEVVIHPDPVFEIRTLPVVQYPAVVNLRSAITGSDLHFSFFKDADLTIPLARPDSLNVRGTYYVKAQNEFGCITVQPVEVAIKPSPEAVVTAPNAFTPNGDGLNDVFRVVVNDRVKMRELKIYNRWGQLLFRTTDLSQGWTGDKAARGMYIWVMEGEDLFSHTPLKKSGYLHLLR